MGNPATNSLASLKRADFIPLIRRSNGQIEYYIALYRGSNLPELKEAITDLAFLLSKEGKKGDKDFATIYAVEDKYIGKGLGGFLGAGIGYQIGGFAGLLLGFVGGILAGELADIIAGEKLVGVVEWPILSYY
nr:hypothetical protein [Acidianus sp. RZ1]